MVVILVLDSGKLSMYVFHVSEISLFFKNVGASSLSWFRLHSVDGSRSYPG